MDEPKKKYEWQVTVPIAGEAYVTVIAETEEEAFTLAMDEVKEIDDWSTYEKLHAGNVCYVSTAWEIEAENMGEVAEEEV